MIVENKKNNIMFKDNKWIVNEIINLVRKDEKRNKSLENAINRNGYLTSDYDLPYLTIKVYKEGYYLMFEGCRCGFNVFCEDKDGELTIKRKPNENKLNLIYKCDGQTSRIIEL